MAPPAPSAPSSVSEGWNGGNGGGGVVLVGTFSSVGGATSYEWGANFVINGSTSGMKRMANCGTTQTMTGGSFRVRVRSSGWAV